MLKKWLTILGVLFVLAGLVLLTLQFAKGRSEDSCQDIRLTIMDKPDDAFINKDEILNLLAQRGFLYKGVSVDKVDFQAIERLVRSHKLVERAECYVSPSGIICLDIWQRHPVMHVIGALGDFYIDSNGKRTGLSAYNAADVVVATGAIKDSATVGQLFKLALLLKENSYWDALIEQIVVNNDGEWLLIPRLGDFEIEFGKPENVERKLNRIAVFIHDYLPGLGWDKYSSINVKFSNQIVCTKKHT